MDNRGLHVVAQTFKKMSLLKVSRYKWAILLAEQSFTIFFSIKGTKNNN